MMKIISQKWKHGQKEVDCQETLVSYSRRFPRSGMLERMKTRRRFLARGMLERMKTRRRFL